MKDVETLRSGEETPVSAVHCRLMVEPPHPRISIIQNHIWLNNTQTSARWAFSILCANTSLICSSIIENLGSYLDWGQLGAEPPRDPRGEIVLQQSLDFM